MCVYISSIVYSMGGGGFGLGGISRLHQQMHQQMSGFGGGGGFHHESSFDSRQALPGAGNTGGGNSGKNNSIVTKSNDGCVRTVTVTGGKGGDRGPVVGRSSSSSMVCINGKRQMVKETTLMYADGTREIVREEMK